jgi:hypothetical protein
LLFKRAFFLTEHRDDSEASHRVSRRPVPIPPFHNDSVGFSVERLALREQETISCFIHGFLDTTERKIYVSDHQKVAAARLGSGASPSEQERFSPSP